MPAFIDRNGETQQVTLNVGMYREAASQGLTFAQYINRQYPTMEGQATAFDQMLASEGMFIRPVKEIGLRSANMDEILNGRREATTTKEAVPASRILFPAAILSAIEDRLAVDRNTTPDAFESMIAIDDSINGDRYERPVLNFSKPEGARSMGITQLALPVNMLTITASDVTRKIPTTSLGLEISEQAVKAATLDIVGLSLARQAAVERNERAQGYIMSLLNGDLDQDIPALATIPGKVAKANSFDSSITVAGKLTQKAWIKWLAKNSSFRRIDYIITDLDGAFAIENREGRPTVMTDNPTSPRIDTLATIINPGWATQPKIFLVEAQDWPAGMILGLDSRYAIHRVKSLTASYEAVENLVMRRATQMRFDSGEIIFRLYDQAFECLSLTL